MSLTIDQHGEAFTETIDGITLPVDCSFEKVNGWIHGVGVQFEELKSLCLGMSAENDNLRRKINQFERGAPCLNFCESQAFKIEIRQLKAACEKALDAMQWGTGDEPLQALKIEAITELKRVLSK